MDVISCEDYERVLRGAGDIPVYAGMLAQRGGFSIGGSVRNFAGSVLPIVKNTIKNAVKRNIHGVMVDKMFKGKSLGDSIRGRGRKELGKVMREVADAVIGEPAPRKKQKVSHPKKKKKALGSKKGVRSGPGRIRTSDIFQ